MYSHGNHPTNGRVMLKEYSRLKSCLPTWQGMECEFNKEVGKYIPIIK